MDFDKILQSSVAQFEFSCTYLAHGHDIQQNVGVKFFYSTFTNDFYFCHLFLRFNVFLLLFERFFTSMASVTLSSATIGTEADDYVLGPVCLSVFLCVIIS